MYKRQVPDRFAGGWDSLTPRGIYLSAELLSEEHLLFLGHRDSPAAALERWRQRLAASVRRQLQMCIRDSFKTALPCFFPTRNVMSLMLPLALLRDDRVDLALVVELTQSGNYQGQTILPLRAVSYTQLP